MTLKRLIYGCIGTIVVLWLMSFVLTLSHLWSLEVYCSTDQSNCVALDSLMARLKLANIAALALTASITPAIITVMMIPFGIWFWQQIQKNKKNKKSKNTEQKIENRE